MSDLVTVIVKCVRHGETIATYQLGYGRTLGPSSSPSTEDLIAEAQTNLSNDSLAAPPFDDIEYVISES